MKKCIIGFEFVETRHTGKNIYGVIVELLNAYSIANKIISISFDNPSNNTNAMKSFKQDLRPMLDDALFHLRNEEEM